MLVLERDGDFFLKQSGTAKGNLLPLYLIQMVKGFFIAIGNNNSDYDKNNKKWRECI